MSLIALIVKIIGLYKILGVLHGEMVDIFGLGTNQTQHLLQPLIQELVGIYYFL